MSDLSLEFEKDEYKKSLVLISDQEEIAKLYYPLYKRHQKAILRFKDKLKLEKFLRELEAKVIRSYALYLVTRSAQSEKQLTEKLKQRFFTSSAIREILIFLKKYEFIDDDSLLKQRIKKLISNGYGKLYVYQKLSQQFFLNRNHFDEIFEDVFKQDLVVEKLVAVINKRKKSNDFKDKQKQYLFLRRKGQSHDITEKVLAEVYQNF